MPVPGAPNTAQANRVDLWRFKELGRKLLISALNSVNGAKTVVLDPSLAGPLDLLTEAKLFTQHGVEKLFWLEAGNLTVATANIIYLCRPKIRWIKVIAAQVKQLAKSEQKHYVSLLLVPKSSALVKRILEEEGVLGDITISSLKIEFIPLDDDVISLENDQAFTDLWVDGDETAIYTSAQALITFQRLYGLIPRIVGKGDHASRLCSLIQDLLPHAEASDKLYVPSDSTDSLIILDRRVDMITPMLTQLTYEGLIDEFIGIENSRVELPVSILEPSENQQASSSAPLAGSLVKEKKKKHALTPATDPVFVELRDLNFSSVGKTLNKIARRLDEDYKKRFNLKTTAELNSFVEKLKGGLMSEHKALRVHTGLSEILVQWTTTYQFNTSLEIQQNLVASYDPPAQISAIETMIAEKAKLQSVLRLLCLASITQGGIKLKVLESLKRDFLQTYGYDNIPALLALASPSLAMLLPIPLPASAPPQLASSKIAFPSLRKALRLTVDEPEDPEDPKDIDYVFSGYAPLSVRLVQIATQAPSVLNNNASPAKGKTPNLPSGTNKPSVLPLRGWKGFEDVLADLPGETFDVTVKAPEPKNKNYAPPTFIAEKNKDKSTSTVVFFLGGCTFAEIAALRLVAKQTPGRHIVIATTSIISGDRLIDGILKGTCNPE